MSGFKPCQYHWPGWPTDTDSNNVGQTHVLPGVIKVEAHTETYILGTTNSIVLYYCIDYLQEWKVVICIEAGCIASYELNTDMASFVWHSCMHTLGLALTLQFLQYFHGVLMLPQWVTEGSI